MINIPKNMFVFLNSPRTEISPTFPTKVPHFAKYEIEPILYYGKIGEIGETANRQNGKIGEMAKRAKFR